MSNKYMTGLYPVRSPLEYADQAGQPFHLFVEPGTNRSVLSRAGGIVLRHFLYGDQGVRNRLSAVGFLAASRIQFVDQVLYAEASPATRFIKPAICSIRLLLE